MAFDLNLLQDRIHVRSDAFEGAVNWTWIRSLHDVTWDVICNDWLAHHKDQILRWFPAGGQSAVMAGGNMGLYPALLSRYFSLVYTFEPDPVHFHCLTNNCQFPNVVKFQAALGASNGMVGMSTPIEGNTGMAQVEEVGRNCIPTMTIDQFAFNDLDLLFLDTEGFEPQILEGARDTLTRLSPKLILELGDVDAGELKNYNASVDILHQLGYDEITRISRLDYTAEKPTS